MTKYTIIGVILQCLCKAVRGKTALQRNYNKFHFAANAVDTAAKNNAVTIMKNIAECINSRFNSGGIPSLSSTLIGFFPMNDL